MGGAKLKSTSNPNCIVTKAGGSPFEFGIPTAQRSMSESNVTILASTFSSDNSSSGWGSDDSYEDAPNSRGSSDARSYRSAGLGTLGSARGVMNSPPRGTVRLDKTEARAGETVGVYWDVPTIQTSAGDWIGVYEEGACMSAVPSTLVE